MSDNFQETPPIIPSTDEADYLKEEPKKTPKKTQKTTLKAFHESRGFTLCEDNEGNGYLLPSEMTPGQFGVEFDVDLGDKDITPLYNWDKEIKALFPNGMKTIADNIRKALWQNGAISKEAAKQNNVQKNLMRNAFPYRIELEKEE